VGRKHKVAEPLEFELVSAGVDDEPSAPAETEKGHLHLTYWLTGNLWPATVDYDGEQLEDVEAEARRFSKEDIVVAATVVRRVGSKWQYCSGWIQGQIANSIEVASMVTSKLRTLDYRRAVNTST
jgi:hypothetical protein